MGLPKQTPQQRRSVLPQKCPQVNKLGQGPETATEGLEGGSLHYEICPDPSAPLTSTSQRALELVAEVADCRRVVRRKTCSLPLYSSQVRNFSCSAWKSLTTSPWHRDVTVRTQRQHLLRAPWLWFISCKPAPPLAPQPCEGAGITHMWPRAGCSSWLQGIANSCSPTHPIPSELRESTLHMYRVVGTWDILTLQCHHSAYLCKLLLSVPTPHFAPLERAEAPLTNAVMAFMPQQEDAEEARDKQAPGDGDLQGLHNQYPSSCFLEDLNNSSAGKIPFPGSSQPCCMA